MQIEHNHTKKDNNNNSEVSETQLKPTQQVVDSFENLIKSSINVPLS